MDLDLEIRSNKGNSTESLYNQGMSAINSMKEARSDKIGGKNRKESITRHSKPQVDRAVASAFKYGIFELPIQNYQYKIKDDMLDDEDTIYWRSKKKRVRTPYRLQHHCRDYINPEKDGKKFRRFFVSDGGCSSKKGTKSNKGRMGRTRQNTSKSDQKIPKKDVKKNSQCDEEKRNYEKAQNKRKKEKRRFSAPRVRISKDIVPTQRIFKKLATKENIKEEFCNCSHTDEDSEMTSECDCKCECYTTKSRSNRGFDQSNHPEFIEQPIPMENASETNTSSRTNSDLNMSSITHSQPETTNLFSNNRFKQSRHSLESALSYSQDACNEVDEWFEKPNWNVNRSQYTQGTIQQFDNGLKIEPIDSLPFKNLQETSYIS